MYPQDLGFQADYVAIQPLNGRLRLLDLLFLIHHKLDFFLDGLLHDIRVRILPLVPQMLYHNFQPLYLFLLRTDNLIPLQDVFFTLLHFNLPLFNFNLRLGK